MGTKIQKWGNSLGVRLPKVVTDAQSLKAGSMVKVSSDAQKIVIEIIKTHSPRIQDLVANITDDNKHETVDWGMPQGKEIW